MWIDIKNIEQRLCEMVGTVVDTIFLNNAPIAVAEQSDSFAVVEIGSEIQDFYAYKKTYLYIYLYVREKLSSVEDAATIHDLSNKVLELFPYSDELMSVISPTVTYGGRLDTLSRIIIGCELIIK